MRFDTSQHMRLGQHMKLAPRMIQSMEILQMPLMALQERIEQELEANIALEQVEPGAGLDLPPESGETDESGESGETGEPLSERELVVGEEGSAPDEWERLSTLESTYKDAFDNEYSSSGYRAAASGERDRKMDAMANIAAREASLTEQLLAQWRFAEVAADTARLGEMLIGYIGADGVLGASLETILDQNSNVPGVEVSIERLDAALASLQHWLEPPGIAARDTRESLLLQVDAREAAEADETVPWDDVRTLIESHFDDLLQNRLPRIAQITGFSMPRIQAAMALMRRLDLSPGRDLAPGDVAPIIPDVIVEYDEDDDTYVARLATGVLPSLRVSDEYAALAKDRTQEKATREFVSTNVRNAHWLIDSIRQRSATLLRVVAVVLSRQRAFLDEGSRALKPLPMTEVADELGIHVGTVSRAVADKWIQTPRGMIKLRKLFSGGTETDSGRDMSWEAVKVTLQEIVDGEDKTKPLSDEALARALKERGIEIARRTVVKYRQQLDIPPARRRKVFS